MYIEISGEQSGKTSRLLVAARKHAAAGGQSVVVVPCQAEAEKLENKTPYETLTVIPATRFRHYVDARGGHRADKSSKTTYYFDDFDKYLVAIPVLRNGYYATTPSRIREASDPIKHDLLLQLVDFAQHTEHVIHNFRNSEVGKILKETIKATSRDTVYQRRVLGRYHRKQIV